MPRYLIEIHEIGFERRIIGKEWSRNATDTGYDYTPETEATRQYDRVIYSQSVDELELAKVVAVVNGIPHA
ncbi:MAG TPA: hypothetical protein VFS39_00535 [Nitrospira sp.]|nr:hypothetical protein [Nitrospira sp.]